MEQTWFSAIPNELQSKCVSLSGVGVNSVAWPKTEAIKLLDWLLSKDYLVLGGDVYLLRDGSIVQTFDNWSTDKAVANVSAWSDRVTIAVEVSKEYVNAYTAGITTPLFDLFVIKGKGVGQ